MLLTLSGMDLVLWTMAVDTWRVLGSLVVTLE